MQILWEIGSQTLEILTLVFGILGMTVSLMLLFSPRLAKNISNILNRNVDIEKKIDYLDKNIETTSFFYKYNVIMGLVLIVGSLFALSFFFFSLDITKFIGIFFGSPKNALPVEIIIQSIVWICKFGCLAGLLLGLLLAFAPDRMKRIESKLNSWFETKPVIKKLDNASHDIDSFFFRYNMAVGLTGAILSFFLISLSIINLLD
jgi:hypothetical protein